MSFKLKWNTPPYDSLRGSVNLANIVLFYLIWNCASICILEITKNKCMQENTQQDQNPQRTACRCISHSLWFPALRWYATVRCRVWSWSHLPPTLCRSAARGFITSPSSKSVCVMLPLVPRNYKSLICPKNSGHIWWLYYLNDSLWLNDRIAPFGILGSANSRIIQKYRIT